MMPVGSPLSQGTQNPDLLVQKLKWGVCPVADGCQENSCVLSKNLRESAFGPLEWVNPYWSLVE